MLSRYFFTPKNFLGRVRLSEGGIYYLDAGDFGKEVPTGGLQKSIVWALSYNIELYDIPGKTFIYQPLARLAGAARGQARGLWRRS